MKKKDSKFFRDSKNKLAMFGIKSYSRNRGSSLTRGFRAKIWFTGMSDNILMATNKAFKKVVTKINGRAS